MGNYNCWHNANNSYARAIDDMLCKDYRVYSSMREVEGITAKWFILPYVVYVIICNPRNKIHQNETCPLAEN